MPLHALIIFVKNPIEGNVKTRIAKTTGHAKAVEIYRELLEYTRSVAEALTAHSLTRTVYYGDFINENDLWNGWNKALQPQGDLGERMKQAFHEQLVAGHERVVIIGSDCLELQPRHLEEAFEKLGTHDVVLGPSTDGGYYLLGMNCLHEVLFDNMPWSQPELMQKTLAAIDSQNLSYTLLEPLTDIDEWEDYQSAKAAASHKST
ncbi:MAG: TIGR04282 family arsenosugar biosynthesis glycosyltransferase [Bacteroidetes bacterium]|nr:TIGR04282 family arsenosugar biosynthesis glycosyltransferase [Bacteroidota bacterium]